MSAREINLFVIVLTSCFFKTCVGDEAYTKAMNSEAGRTHHYVVARTLLNQADWEKFVWIEEHGSLEDFPG